MTSTGHDRMVLRPAIISMVLFAAILSPCWLGGLWNIYRYGKFDVGLGLCGISFGLWLWGIGSVRIVAENGFIEQRRLLWREWRLDIRETEIRYGLGGDIPVVPSIILEQKDTRVRGTITWYAFDKTRLEELISFLVAHGAKKV